MKQLEVVAGIIWRGGKFLGSQRIRGSHAGCWEFPGGKVDLGETHLEALRRELREELDITVEHAVPWCVTEHSYNDRTVRLHVFHVLGITGEPRSVEGQPLRWLTPDAARELVFLEADIPLVVKLHPPVLQDVLSPIRKNIDAIDDEIAQLLARRLEYSHEVGRIKRAVAPTAATPATLQPAREAAIVERLETGRDDLPSGYLRNIWTEVFACSRQVQDERPVAVLGPVGGAGYLAAGLALGRGTALRACADSGTMAELIGSGACGLGVLPADQPLPPGLTEQARITLVEDNEVFRASLGTASGSAATAATAEPAEPAEPAEVVPVVECGALSGPASAVSFVPFIECGAVQAVVVVGPAHA